MIYLRHAVLCLTLLVLSSGLVQAAPLLSMSNDTLVDIDGETYRKVLVRCSGAAKKREILKPKNGKKWCFSEAPENCYKIKIVAAQKICSKRYTRLVAEHQEKINGGNTDSAATTDEAPAKQEQTAAETPAEVTEPATQIDVTALQAEKTKIDEERLAIQQKKLSLRRQEIELQKRILEAQ